MLESTLKLIEQLGTAAFELFSGWFKKVFRVDRAPKRFRNELLGLSPGLMTDSAVIVVKPTVLKIEKLVAKKL